MNLPAHVDRLIHQLKPELLGKPLVVAPGNVRELENIIQAAIALAPGDTITEQDLRLESAAGEAVQPADRLQLRDAEQQHIERVLRSVDGNRQEASRILGIDRSTLYRKLQRFASHDAERDSHRKERVE